MIFRRGCFRVTGLTLAIVIVAGAGMSHGAEKVESLIPRSGLPSGWRLMEGPQTFSRKSLFEHIDGQAELFFKYGYQKSAFAVYQHKDNRENQIELDVYEMGTVLQAFGIFSRFRTEDQSGGFGSDSYLDERSAFFYQGKYFVLLQATEPDSEALKQWAAAVAKRLPAPSSPPKEIGYFPPVHLKPGSIQYFSESLLGLQFLRRGFLGTYLSGGKEFQLFLAVQGGPQEAQKAVKAYKDYLASKGKVSPDVLPEWKPNAFRGEDPYKGRIIGLQKGPYVLGAVGFEREGEAENLLADFLKNIK
jgi:hypothetical protein